METQTDYQNLADEIRAAAASLSNLRGATDDLLDLMLHSQFNRLHALADRAAWWAREKAESETAELCAAVIQRAQVK